MTEKTKQRIKQLRELFNAGKPENKDLPEFAFILSIHCDSELMAFVELLPDDLWDDFIVKWKEDDELKSGKVEFDWNCLPAWANRYIAMDKNKVWFSYKEKPEVSNSIWTDLMSNTCVPIPNEYQPKKFLKSWKDSLMKNPKP